MLKLTKPFAVVTLTLFSCVATADVGDDIQVLYDFIGQHDKGAELKAELEKAEIESQAVIKQICDNINEHDTSYGYLYKGLQWANASLADKVKTVLTANCGGYDDIRSMLGN